MIQTDGHLSILQYTSKILYFLKT